MSLTVVGGTAIFVAIFLLSAFFSSAFTRYYEDKYEREKLVTVVTVLGLTVGLCTVFLVPLDVYLVSSTTDPTTGMKYDWATPERIESITHGLKAAYYVFYSMIAFFCFVAMPWTYFYFEEGGNEETVKQRAISASKYTVATIAIVFVLLSTGFFLKNRQPGEHDLDWFKRLLTQDGGEKAITFLIAVMLMLGMLVYVTYTAFGLSAIPVGMIKGRKPPDSLVDLTCRLAGVQERIHAIGMKTKNGANAADKVGSQTDLGHANFNNSDQIALGCLALFFSAVIVVSVFLASVDRITNSICGNGCGWILHEPKEYNPLNIAFLFSAEHFPLDYVVLVILILYLLAACLAALVRVGIRFLWMPLYTIRRSATPPQGLLLATAMLIFGVLPLVYTVMFVAPTYATFGTQKFCNAVFNGTRDCSGAPDSIVPCVIEAPTDICTPTVLSTTINRISYNTPFFGSVYYYAQWVFVAMFLVGLVVVVSQGPRPGDESDESDEETPELERRSLLS
ncbi:hypothetical protein HK104_009964 [Borealophlyctis nickersoniae]|nr:hypothetical protein HK104_009964 [Borealophlyctis nickersoniae]